jgi:hypothetical protein
MTEARMSRVVVAALHQALAEHIPLRLEFYEHYLRPMRLRDGRVGVAPFLAALSFLRREDHCWDVVMDTAGRYAADWTLDAVSTPRRALLRRLPTRWRVSAALRVVGRLVGDTRRDTRARRRTTPHGGRLHIEGSPFCEVRDPVEGPLCRFYAAAAEQVCRRLGLDVAVSWASCRAMNGTACELLLELRRAGPANPAGGRGLVT